MTIKLGWLAALALGGLVAFGNTSFAAEENPAGRRGQGRGDRLTAMAEQLSLTDEQKEKLKPILEEQSKKMREIFQDSNVSREDRMKKMQELRDATNAKIKPILTKEQQEKWDKMQEQMRQRRQQRPQQ